MEKKVKKYESRLMTMNKFINEIESFVTAEKEFEANSQILTDLIYDRLSKYCNTKCDAIFTFCSKSTDYSLTISVDLHQLKIDVTPVIFEDVDSNKKLEIYQLMNKSLEIYIESLKTRNYSIDDDY